MILDPEPRPQPVFPNEGDNRAYAKYQKDLEEWEKDYLKYKDISCRCKKAYYCKAHGQFVSGADVRNGKAPSQSDQTPETCHKKGYFCREHKQWVSDADVESRHSTDQKCQTRATCHTDGYFCTKHKRWVPGDMIRNRVAPSQRKQTPETCHIFAKDQNTTLHPPPVDESCELGNGIVASRFKPTADYGGGQSSSIGYIASAPIAGNVNYAQQSSYTVSSQSQYQVYTSTPATTGYTGYPAPQNLDFGPQPSNPASASSEASYSVRQSTPAYNAAYAAQKYSTATVSTTPYQYPASELQATLSYQSASSLVAERYDDRDPPAQSQYDRSAGYEGSYSLAPAQQSSTKYQVARYGATPSSSTPVEYAQPEGSRDYEEVYQEDSRQSSRRHKGDHVQSSRRDKKKSSKG